MFLPMKSGHEFLQDLSEDENKEMSTKKYNKKEYNWILSLLTKQKKMLRGHDQALDELYKVCDNDCQRTLLKDLIIRFNCFDDDVYNMALLDLSTHIASLGYPIDKIALVAVCHDSEADSSQAVLNDLKVYVQRSCGSVKYINRFDKIPKYYNEGIRHFIAVDEFSGTGQTLCNRYKQFVSNHLSGATIDFCVIAGMKAAENRCREQGLDLYLIYSMERGISDYYTGESLALSISEMQSIELKLAEKINRTVLSSYNFGYGRSESLYTRLDRNVPNNVFPVFWWKRYKDNTDRVPLLYRVQDGY